MRSPAFRDNVVVLTGASGGIGSELARQLADQGASLVLASPESETERLEALAADCRARGARALMIPRDRPDGCHSQGPPAQAEGLGGAGVPHPQASPPAAGTLEGGTPNRAMVVATDVTDEAQCRALVDRAVREFGRLDTLITCAGIGLLGKLRALPDLSAFERVMRVNFSGTVYCVYHALPHLVASRGRIVGISSILGRLGAPRNSAYCASKHALAGFFDSLRSELRRDGVSVTVIYPNLVRTELAERILEADGRERGARGREVWSTRVMSAERCARLILRAAARRRRQRTITAGAHLALWLNLIVPRLVDAAMRRQVARWRQS